MELTKIERLILLNQYRILEKLYPEEEETYSLYAKILEHGYKMDYDSLVEGLYDGMTEEACLEVRDILQMHRCLKFSFDNLEDKADLTEDDVKFRGFDGNEEGSYLIYSRFILHDLGRYSELWSNSNRHVYNSHFPMLEKYIRMLAAWRSVSDRHNSNLSIDQIKEIINA